MPASPRRGELLVIFTRHGQPADEQVAHDGEDAVAVATAMLLVRIALEPGDCLAVSKVPPTELPETSRASHFS
jgi:hypothetical protein